MDARRTGPASRNGSGICSHAMAKEEDHDVAHVGDRSPGHCPYGLGADCPLVEVVKGTLVKERRLTSTEKTLPMVVGMVLTVVAIYIVHG